MASTGEAGAGAGPAQGRREWWWLAAILGVALVIRLVVLVRFPNIYYTDEVHHYLEQAHRIVFGYGWVPFDVSSGIRSMTVPGLLAVPLWLASLVSDEPEVLTTVVGAAVVLLSLLSVVGAWIAGRRLSQVHAIVAASVVAVWYELVHHAARTLTEAMATAPLILALALAGTPAPRRRTLALTGVLLGACIVLRFQLAPAALLIGGWVAWRNGRRSVVPLLVGALVPLAILGAVDWWVQGIPFGSIVNNVRINVVEHFADNFGVTPPWEYLVMWRDQWLAVGPVLVVLVLLGARRLPLWLLTAAVIIASHSLIGHKEYRFILPAMGVLVVLAAIGSAEILVWMRRELQGERRGGVALAGLLLMWAATSWMLALGPSEQFRWSDRRAVMAASHHLHDQPDVCGIGLRGIQWWDTGAYSHIHLRVPIFQLEAGTPDAHPEAYDIQLFRPSSQPDLPEGYAQEACFATSTDQVCVLRRPGGCRHVDGLDPAQPTDGVPM
ncbi:MAG: hypothetical protein U0869_16010 [Chloroflexota bacterium]